MLFGCAEEITGPQPELQPPTPGAELPVEPGVICRAQINTDVVLRGEKLSPIPFDVPNDPKTALPEISLLQSAALDGTPGDMSEAIRYASEPGDDQPNSALLSWQSQQQMTFQVNQSLVLPDGNTGVLPLGIFDVKVVNPNTNEATSPGSIAVVDRPFIDENGLAPGITCLAQGERTITVNGSMALRLLQETPDVTIGDASFAVVADDLAECTTIAHPAVDAEICDSFDITLGQDSVPVGYDDNDVVVLNPETATSPEAAGCISEEQRNLRVVPPPSIVSILEVAEDASATTDGTGTVVCPAGGDRQVVLVGTDFLVIDGADPIVTMVDSSGTAQTLSVNSTDGCSDLETQGHTVQLCTSVTVTVPQEDITEPYQPEITVENPAPAGCTNTTTTLLTLTPAPVITEVVPPLICLDDGARDVVVEGEGFVVIDGVVPEVVFDATTIDAANISGQACTDLGVPNRTVERCTQLLVTIPQGALAEGQPDLTVTNPMPAGCSDSESGLLTIVPGPELTSAEPALVCTEDGARSIVLTGVGFLRVNTTELPTVTMDGTDVTVDSLDNCTPLTVNGLTVEACTTINVTAAQGSLTEGDTEVIVANPAPAGCTVTNTTILTVPPALALTSATPATVCQSAAGNLDVTVSGTGFLRVGGTDFTVAVEGTTVTPSSITDCTALDVDGLTVESCNTFVINVDASQYAVGGVGIAVTNPAPSGCAESSSEVFEIVAPPTISTIVPADICEQVEETVTITGTNFAQNATVLIGNVAANAVTANNCDVNGVCTELVATWNDGTLVAGDYDVTVSNAAGCESTVPNGITVNPTPLVFFVDPPVIYNGINTDATVFTTGLSGLAQKVEIIDSSGNRTELTSFDSPVRPNRIIATVPLDDPNNTGNPIPAGDYEVSVTSNFGCESVLNGQVTITDSLTLALEMIDPAFASPTQPTAVTITATDPAPAGEVQFESTPRVYLNPTTGGQVATAVQAVVFESATTLTAVIPAGLTPGQYDLIVVNPSGAVGLLSAAVTVTTNEPPIVTAVSPSSLDAAVSNTATIFGTGFETEPANAIVDLECRDFSTGASVSSGAVTVDSATGGTELGVTIDASSIPIGAVCVVTVTNSDGSAFRYSAISFKNGTAPAATLNPWTISALTMNEARRAPGLEAGRPTFRSRFLYVAGGDDGTAANTKATVESIGVDAFGSLDAVNGWIYQRNNLANAYVAGSTTSSPRAFAGMARVGRFLYLTGGTNGTTPTNTVLRAQVLDPLDGPEIVDLDAELGDGSNGLTEGLWYYKVSALFPDSDPSNPGGESLPGEVLNVQLPAVNENIILTLNWEQVAGASGYRVYRTAAADGSVDNLELLVEVSGGTTTSYRDTGGTTDNTVTPMPQGSTGVWHSVSSLATARSAHATVAVPDPANASQYFLYAVGGDNGSGPVNTGEYATVTIAGDGSQTISAWTPLADTLSTAVSELGGFVVTPLDTDVIVDGTGTDTFVYFGTGYTGTTATGTMNVAEIAADGQITAFTSPGDGPTPGRAGSAYFAGGGFLYILGGANRSASSGNDVSKDIINTSGGISGGAWDSLGGGAFPSSIIYPGTTQESAFFFAAGGATSGTNGAVTDTVFLTIQ